MDTRYIETHEFFSSLDPGFRQRVVDASCTSLVEKDENLFTEGEIAENFYLIETGSIEVSHAKVVSRRARRILQPGDLVGWSWLVPPYRWSVSGKALEDCRVFRFDGFSLLLQCEDDPAFGYALTKRFAGMMGKRLADLHDVGFGKERMRTDESIVDAITRIENAALERRRNLAI